MPLPPARGRAAGPDDDNRRVYETFYGHDHLSLDRPLSRYDRELVALRSRYLRELGAGVVVADLGCGTGAYLLGAAAEASLAYGVDFSGRLLGICAERVRSAGARNIRLVQADVRAIPLRDASVDLAFSIATLYHVPDVGRAIREAVRIVRPGGHLLLELGNLWSLNTLVDRHNPSGVRSHHISVAEMRRHLRRDGLDILEHRAFQLLPMYGGPLWLRPLVSARWKWLMGRTFGGRLLDEIVSSLPGLRQLAFRHLFVCRRV